MGCHVVEQLKARGCSQIFVPRSQEYDLRDPEAVKRVYQAAKPSLVIHLAATVGGIGANAKHPGAFFYDNAMMGLLMMERAHRVGVSKFVAMGTICSYPKFTPTPFKEENLWNGYPEETNAPYGLAKKMLLVQAQAYRKEYGFNAITLFPTNLYGPGDNFDLSTSHVIPALIRKFLEAKEKGLSQVIVWGTGTPTREFLHVQDAAEGILLAAEKYNDPAPVNLGSGTEISIRDLAEKIRQLTGFAGTLQFDSSKPDGQPRRLVDTSRAKKEFGFQAQVMLEKGLRETIDWYLKNRTRIESSSMVEVKD